MTIDEFIKQINEKFDELSNSISALSAKIEENNPTSNPDDDKDSEENNTTLDSPDEGDNFVNWFSGKEEEK